MTQEFGLRPLMSCKGNGYDNAAMENCWGSLKHELVHHRRFATRTEVETAMPEHREICYSHQRRHARLGYVAPAVFVENLANPLGKE